MGRQLPLDSAHHCLIPLILRRGGDDGLQIDQLPAYGRHGPALHGLLFFILPFQHLAVVAFRRNGRAVGRAVAAVLRGVRLEGQPQAVNPFCVIGIEDINEQINEIYDEESNLIDVVRHPKQIVYLKISKKLNKYDLMRIKY